MLRHLLAGDPLGLALRDLIGHREEQYASLLARTEIYAHDRMFDPAELQSYITQARAAYRRMSWGEGPFAPENYRYLGNPTFTRLLPDLVEVSGMQLQRPEVLDLSDRVHPPSMIPSRTNDKIFFAQRRRRERHLADEVAALQEQVELGPGQRQARRRRIVPQGLRRLDRAAPEPRPAEQA